MGLIRHIASFLTLAAATALQCKDDSGRDVAWWIAVKAPRGTTYWYGDASAPDVFAQSAHSMNDTEVGALGATLRQIWTAPTTPAYILWNDDPPQSDYYNFSYGHTKGALVVDTTSQGGGFWLTHSVPKFPAGPTATPSYIGLGSNAWMYGQSAACFSLPATDTAALASLASTLQFNHPHVYDTGGDFSSAPASVGELAGGEWRADPVCQQVELQLGGDVAATVFAKTPAWNADLWAGCVSPALKSDLWVESWLRGSEEGPACGTAWQTLDIQSLTWGQADASWSETSRTASVNTSWSEHDDHSKWAVAPNASALCIGDINRMTTQYERAGGTVCFTAGPVAAFSAAVTATDTC